MFEKLFPVWYRHHELRKAMRRYRKEGYPAVRTKMYGRELPPVGHPAEIETPNEVRNARAAGDHVWGVRK